MSAAFMDCVRAETLLSVEDVCMSYGNNEILSHVNVKIDNLYRTSGAVTGQIVAFLGPSGVGKTQLLRILAGLQKPTSGEVYLGVDRNKVRPGSVGLVSQNYLLYRNRDILGNLRVSAMQKCHLPFLKALTSYFTRRKEAKRLALEMLAKFDLTAKSSLYPAQLSGGQRQRVSIAQQLLCSEHFLLMDEPTAGLDPLAKEKVCNLITEVANQDDLNTIIMVTHDIRSAISVADTVWLMGRDRDASGNIISGAKIKEQYDLIERGLLWHPDVSLMPEFVETEREIVAKFKLL